MSDTISILIADDHPVFRGGLRALIQSEPGLSLADEAVDGSQAIALTRKLKPDVLLLDLAMPRRTGLEVLRDLAPLGLPTRVALLTATIEEEQVTEALRLGARGVILKDTATELLVKAIRCIVAGEFWVGRNNVNGLVQAMKMAYEIRPDDVAEKFALTARELEVVAAIIEGETNKDIAKRLAISEQTVKHHLSSIFDKVGVSNRLELALFSVNHQLVGKRS
ncbi:MAG TPA: response regulator transcription factor [Terriglobia bacterium]|nr:response regulator transcription factor [Terriglobia bacterium]